MMRKSFIIFDASAVGDRIAEHTNHWVFVVGRDCSPKAKRID
jgi:hypothetical protein